MSLSPKTIYNVQRTSDGTAWAEVYISGSNLILQTDQNGVLTGSSVFSASYATSASYVNTASVNILQSSIVSNQTVGGVSSGTTINSGTSVESLLRKILISYIPPTVSSLAMKYYASNISTSDRDVNNSFVVNTASFVVGLDNPDGFGPISSSWTASGADIGTLTKYFGDASLSGGALSLSVGSNYTINKASAAGDITFTINGKSKSTGGSISSAITSVSFKFRNYFCASSTVIASNSDAQTVIDSYLISSTLASSKSSTLTCTAANDTVGNYTYILYPSSYGDLSNIIQNGSLPVLTAFTKLGDYTVTNAYGASVALRVYKSNSTKAFSSGTTLAVS